jgi:type IV secretion system protein VirB1
VILELAAVLGLASTCAPGIAPETLAAIARAESGFDTLAINVNGPGGGRIRPAGTTDAVARARALIAAGRSVDLGLMQVNSRNLGWLGLSVEDAFDPCRSVAAGARVLTAFSGYNTGSPHRGFANGYVARVLAAGSANEAAPAAPPSPAPQPAASCAPSWDVWARCAAPAHVARASDPADDDEGAPPSAAPALLRGRLAMGAEDR